MRLSPGKTELLLLDFLWLTERHDLCRPSSLVSKDETIAQKIDERMKEDPDGFDLVEAEEEAERDVLSEREASLARQLAEMRGKKRKLVDPIQYALSIAAEDVANYEPTFAWEMAPPSEKQIAFLERRGIFADSVMNAGLASLLIDRLQRRQDLGLATPKQIRCLERYGFRQVGTGVVPAQQRGAQPRKVLARRSFAGGEEVHPRLARNELIEQPRLAHPAAPPHWHELKARRRVAFLEHPQFRFACDKHTALLCYI